MLSFNGQEPLTLDAKIRSTGFIKSIDISQKDTSITIQAGDSLYKLAVTLHNITKPGTYPFNRAFNGRKSVSCQYVDYISGDIYATCRMPSAGSITLAVISNDLIVGVFNAELTNVYPGSSGTIKTISLTNGYFNGKLETVIR